MLFGEDGLIGRAVAAGEVTSDAEFREQVQLDIMDVIAEIYAEGNEPTMDNVIGKLKERGYEVYPGNTPETIVVEKDGKTAIVDNDFNTTTPNEEEEEVYIGGEFDEEKQVNTPKLGKTGLIPVTINADGSTTDVLDPENEDWYSYEENDRRWANARTADGSLWVWIPRYEYKISYTNPANKSEGGTIDLKFIPSSQTTPTRGRLYSAPIF